MIHQDQRVLRFTILCNTTERQLITAIAEHLNRSQGDAVRFLIRAAGQELKIDLKKPDQEDRQPVEVTNG